MTKREDPSPPSEADAEAKARAMLEASVRGEVTLEQLALSVGGDLAWQFAIMQWRKGSGDALANLLGGSEPVPQAARAFLADMAAGRVERKRGRPAAREWTTLGDVVQEMAALSHIQATYRRHLATRQAARDAERRARPGARDVSPSDQAIDDTAAELDLPARTVSGVVHRRQRRRIGAAQK